MAPQASSFGSLTWLLPVGVLLAALAGAPRSAAAPSEAELLAGAPQRIEKYRKADATIQVLDAAGKPLAGAKVQVRQVRHEFLFGSNIFYFARPARPDDDPKLLQAYLTHYEGLLNYATLPFYWPSYERERGRPQHAMMAKAARWCKDHHIATKGHPLAWNYSDARWFPSDPDELFRLQVARVGDCVKRFRGLIDMWDVVNEATHYDRADLANRRAPKLTAAWKKVGQIEFTKACFHAARQASPDATLLINDYRTDPAYEKVIRQLTGARGKGLYDVIGIQSHMHGGAWPTRKIWDVCERFAKFGVPLHFTETTILSGKRTWQGKRGQWPSTPEGEAYQAREVVRFYTMLFSHPAVEAVTWWDFSDTRAWKGAPAGFLRADMTPKPAYHALKKLIKTDWWTTTTLTTGAKGQATFRGFRGDYELIVTAPGRTRKAAKRTLAKGKPNRWTLKP